MTSNQSIQSFPSEPIQRYIDPTGMSAAMVLVQAKVLAQDAVAQFFAQNPTARQVKVYVFADYAGQLVPVLSGAIDRTVGKHNRILSAIVEPLRQELTYSA
ncbi:MAG: hypothetical protein HC860_00020 [Alkalinema sp. RU_4_3]|nr:hypothetical protein [Alkalinema sp. RU_4_3]